MRYIKRLFPLLALLTTSCANPYSQFYVGSSDASELPGYVPVHRPLRIIQTDNFQRDGMKLLRRGYLPIGRSSFNAPTNRASMGQLQEQAKKIGAEIVLYSSRYTNTVRGAMPYQAPQTTISNSTGAATAYGPGGVVNAYGNGTTTTYGSQTIMMPYAISHSDFMAVFYAKDQSHIGIVPKSLDNAIRRRIQSDTGVYVYVIVDGSSAFRANILPGDVVLAVDEKPVDSVRGYMRLLKQYQGHTVTLRLDRDGTKLDKKLYDQPYGRKAASQSQGVPTN